MRIFSRKFFINIFFLLIIAGAVYYYQNDIRVFIDNQLAQFRPCEKPITYSLGAFDKRFGITEKQFLNTLTEAEKIWESYLGKPLFRYEEKKEMSTSVTINLIYDSRQQATDKLKKLGIVIGSDKNAHNMLKIKYDSLASDYSNSKKDLEKIIASYQIEKIAYEKEVIYWNNKGGAPKDKYEVLEQERINLNNKVNNINQMENALSEKGDILNALVIELNKLAKELNLQVETYNITGANKEEFDEGEYISDDKSKTINIYQFYNQNKLLRVLAHELGHALGLMHVENPKSIMYRLNQNSNEKLTNDDILALKRLCDIK